MNKSVPILLAAVTLSMTGWGSSARASEPAETASTSAAPTPAAATTKSIRNWVTCDGTTDDSLGAANAFGAAKNGAFTLLVDCPVRIHIGSDISRPIFIDSGTTVVFSGAGKFTIDNIFVPAFVIANSTQITLTNWNVEWDGSLPVNWNVGGYVNNGVYTAATGTAQPAGAFNDRRLTPWLAANRHIVFDASKGHMTSPWAGAGNTSSVFYYCGSSSYVTVTGMKLYAPAQAGGNQFIPMAFSFTTGFKSYQSVNVDTPNTAAYIAVPHYLTFTNIDLDGTYMGWQGNLQYASFEQIHSHRYGDLQDANGKNVGGIGKWFAPPHLFYLNYDPSGDPLLINRDIHIADVVDDGIRLGVARDKPGEAGSGYALSLKIGCNECSVDGYVTSRPDGFLDVLPSNGLSISNVTASYDSAFLNNLYTGWRFPTVGYKNVTFTNISLTDTAAQSYLVPVGDAYSTTNENLHFINVQGVINKWMGSGMLPLPNVNGTGIQATFDFTVLDTAWRIVRTTKVGIQVTLQATPATLKAGGATSLIWRSNDATSCSGSGAWSGALVTSGGLTLKAVPAGNHQYVLYCATPSVSAIVQIPVLAN